MNLFIVFVLMFINKIGTFDIDGSNYKIFKGKKALLNITDTIGARSVIECATKYENSNQCTHANFRNKTCQFLKHGISEMVIDLEKEAETKYIYPLVCHGNECLNGGNCISSAEGITCQCLEGYTGEACGEEINELTTIADPDTTESTCDGSWTMEECDLVHRCQCYVVVQQDASWYEARDYCITQGGRLLEVCDSTLNDLILDLLAEKGMQRTWAGGSDAQVEGQWEWISGSCNWEWADWGPHNDHAEDQDCLYIDRSHDWADTRCTWTWEFICEL